MTDWRETILKNFKPKIARLTLVSDPDGLLTEEGMLSAIRERGFDLIPFDDPIAFRFAYESQYRSLWDKGEQTDLVVVLRSTEHQLNTLPFDLLKAGRHLSFALHRLFPLLNYPVIAGLDRVYLDAVEEAYQKHSGGQLSERETKSFVLMHCFSIVPTLIKKPVDLMKVLLSLHSRKVGLPDVLREFLLESLSEGKTFKGWPLGEILGSRESFLRFLQEEWKAFLDTLTNPSAPACRVPFSHEDVLAYIDTLFLDGSLTPVERKNGDTLPAWAQTGVVCDPRADAIRRFRGLWRKFEAEIPSAEVSHREWQQAAERWAELVVLRWECDESLEDSDRTAWSALQKMVEGAFGGWMMQRFGSLHNLPYRHQPVMVHQIPRFMAVERKQKKIGKIALLVLDGLAIDQWLLIKKQLEASDGAWRFRESSAFAWVPTLTSVTRQSIFAGEPPLYFADSLATTAKEKNHWLRFWEDQGVPRASIDLVTNLDGPTDPKLDTAFGNSRLSVLGLIWNQVDEIMHGMQMQTPGMHSQVRLWAAQGHLQQLLARLHDEDFTVYLTADHGNVSATGVGNPNEGVLAETKGKRVRVYDSAQFLGETAEKFPDSVRWTNQGLPPAKYVLLAGGLTAFTDVGEKIVSHGGIALEEVMVPFVAITREKP